MTSWYEAQRAWERSQPQLFFEVDDLPSLPVGDQSPSEVRGTDGSGAPATGSSIHDNAVSAQSLPGTRALTAKGV